MKEQEYNDLAKRANEAIDLFRKIQGIRNMAEELSKVPSHPSKITRIQIEIEYEDGGMINRRQYWFDRANLFWPRVVKEFLAMIGIAKEEAQKTFEKL